MCETVGGKEERHSGRPSEPDPIGATTLAKSGGVTVRIHACHDPPPARRQLGGEGPWAGPKPGPLARPHDPSGVNAAPRAYEEPASTTGRASSSAMTVRASVTPPVSTISIAC